MGYHDTGCTGLKLWGIFRERWLGNLTTKSYSHLPTYYVKQEMRGETQLLKKTDIQHHLVAANRYSTFHFASKTSSTHSYPLMTQTKTQSISISSMSLSLHRPSGAYSLVMDYLAILWNTDPTSASYSNIWLPFMWWHLSMTTGPLRRETSRQRSSVLISLSAVYENTWKQDFSVSPWKTSGGRHHSSHCIQEL